MLTTNRKSKKILFSPLLPRSRKSRQHSIWRRKGQTFWPSQSVSNGDVTSGTTTDSGTQKKTSTTRAFHRKNKQKSCRYFTNTHELGTIKRNVISVIMCTQTERAQTSNVTRFARDGVGPFDCMCLCVCAGLNLTLFPPEKRPFTLTKGK